MRTPCGGRARRPQGGDGAGSDRPDRSDRPDPLDELVAESRAVRPWTEARRQHLLEQIEERVGVGGGRPRAVYLAVAAGCAALATVLVLRVLPASSERVVAGVNDGPWHAVASGVVADRGAVVRSVGGAAAERLIVDGGRLRGERASLVLVTPFLEATVAGASFQLAVNESVATLILDEGIAELLATGGARLSLRAPATISSDDPRLRPSSAAPALAPSTNASLDALPEATMPASAACAEVTDPERRGCLEGEAAGQGIAAQNALVALGLLEAQRGGGAGLARFLQYQARFPSGILAPEAAGGVVRELIAAGRFDEAEAAAAAYLVRFPSDPRVAEIHLTRARLLQRRLHDPARARDAYAAALAAGLPAALADDATFAIGACEEELGHQVSARAAWQRYLDRFPAGRHTDEATRSLGP